jgi:protease-4
MRKVFSGIMSLLDGIRRILLNGLLLVFVLIVVVGLMREKTSLPESAVLLIDPQGQVVEQIEQPSPDAFPFAFPDTNQSKLRDMVYALEKAKTDARIKAVQLDLSAMQRVSLPSLQTLKDAVQSFKESGKPVIAVGNAFSQAQYYLAASADTIFLHPMGMLELTGFSVYRNYIRSALEKLNIDVHIFRVGDYKSAVEPFIRDDMSSADKEANQAWLSSLWNAYKQDVAHMRGMKAAHIQEILDNPAVYLAKYHGNVAEMFKAEGLVDKLGDAHDAEIFLANRLQWDNGDELPMISFKKYIKYIKASVKPNSDKDKIGLIVASGTIINGEQPAGVIGSETVSQLLRDAADDDRVKAVVLRIDSPGGSALASEVVRKEVVRLRKSGKPVVVSMGSVAASGGYWIATAGDEIWAQPTTLTGSIGVFGIVPNVSRALEKLGVYSDGVGTTKLSTSMRADIPLSDEMKSVIQMGVNHVYKRFVGLVAEARGMQVQDVEAIAQGRVWSGVDAQRLGLVDQLGGLDDAIASAAKRGKMGADYEVKEIKAPLSLPEMMAQELFGEADAFVSLKAMWGNDGAALLRNPIVQDVFKPLHFLTQLNDPNYVYAYSGL